MTVDFKTCTGSSVFLFLIVAILLGRPAPCGAETPNGTSAGQSVCTVDYSLISFSSDSSRLLSLREQPMVQSSEADSGYQVVVEANVPRFNARINGEDHYGNPVRIKDLGAGFYLVQCRLGTFKDLDIPLQLRAGYQYLIKVELVLRTGGLLVRGDQPIGRLQIDGESATPGLLMSLPIGRHRVQARSFGWQDFDQELTINEDMLTSVSVTFAPAQFEVRHLSASRSQFRPTNPGSLGESTLSFEVTAPGTGRISIYATDGTLVTSHEFPEFEDWAQSYVWNGRDGIGTPLPEGEYTWHVEAIPLPQAPGERQESSAHVAIDYASFIKFRPNLAGTPGMGLAGEAFTLAQGAFQASTRVSWLPASQASGAQDSLQFSLGGRFGLVRNLEISLVVTGAAGLSGAGLATALAGGEVGWAVLPLPADSAGGGPDFGLSLDLGGAFPVTTLSPRPYRAWANSLIPGGHAGINAQVRFGPFSIAAEPVVYVSPWPPFLGPNGIAGSQELPVPSPYLFGSLALGFYLDLEQFNVGLSAALRTDQTGIPGWPVPISLALQLMPVPGFVVGVDITENLDPAALGLPSIGLGIGLIQ